jgi:solute carrier family 24 (sodium/potassium/calcium exchanger), member 6
MLSVAWGLAWCYLLIGIVVDMMNSIGVFLNLSKTIIGLTVLAIGNGLPDALITIELTKQGAGMMAISGGYSG